MVVVVAGSGGNVSDEFSRGSVRAFVDRSARCLQQLVGFRRQRGSTETIGDADRNAYISMRTNFGE